MVFRVITLCGPVGGYQVLEEHTASTFRADMWRGLGKGPGQRDWLTFKGRGEEMEQKRRAGSGKTRESGPFKGPEIKVGSKGSLPDSAGQSPSLVILLTLYKPSTP
jgi:hypothetical protein